MDSNQYGFKQTCRCCLINTVDTKSLYESYLSQMPVTEALTYITSLKFSDDQDDFPTHICLICFCELHLSYKFVLKCRESDRKLRKISNADDIKSENAFDALPEKLISPINAEQPQYESNNFEIVDGCVKLIDKSQFNYELAIVKHIIKVEPENTDIDNRNDHSPPVDEPQEPTLVKLEQNITTEARNSGEKRLNENGVIEQKHRRRKTTQVYLQDITTEIQEGQANTKHIDIVNKTNSSVLCHESLNELVKNSHTHPDEKLNPSPFPEHMESFSTHAYMPIPTIKEEYSCTICNKTFCNETDLIAHTQVHTDKSSYCCTVCDKSFKNRVNLITHMRKHEKKFPCTLCNESFRIKFNLTVHMQIEH